MVKTRCGTRHGRKAQEAVLLRVGENVRGQHAAAAANLWVWMSLDKIQ